MPYTQPPLLLHFPSPQIGCEVAKCAGFKGNCGRGGTACDAGFRCDHHPTDKWAVCCPVKTQTDDGKPICCKAMTPTCLACQAGLGDSARVYCEKNTAEKACAYDRIKAAREAVLKAYFECKAAAKP